MKYSESIKSISYLKANAASILNELSKNHESMIITQNGEAKAVLQDIKKYEEMQESLALLKILALGEKEISDGKTKDMEMVFAEMDKNIKNEKE